MKKELRELSKPKKNVPILSDEDINELFNALNPDRQKIGPVRRKLCKLRGSFEHYVNNQKMKRLTKTARKHIKKNGIFDAGRNREFAECGRERDRQQSQKPSRRV